MIMARYKHEVPSKWEDTKAAYLSQPIYPTKCEEQGHIQISGLGEKAAANSVCYGEKMPKKREKKVFFKYLFFPVFPLFYPVFLLFSNTPLFFFFFPIP